MEFVYIGFGWLLGLLAPAITKRIADYYEKQNLEKIILNDLKDLKKRLAPISFKVFPKYSMLNEETFNWLRENSGIIFSEEIQKEIERGTTLQTIIKNINLIGSQDNTLAYFKKMHLFAIDSHLINLSILEDSSLEKILEIRFHVEAFNEEIDSFREHLKMTFLPGITDHNHRIISQELKNKSLNIAKTSMSIVDKINNLLEISDARERSEKLSEVSKNDLGE